MSYRVLVIMNRVNAVLAEISGELISVDGSRHENNFDLRRLLQHVLYRQKNKVRIQITFMHFIQDFKFTN